MFLDSISIPVSVVHVALCLFYVQAGLLLLGYVFLRRLRDLNGSVAAEAAGRTAMIRSLERALAGLEQRLAEFELGASQRRTKRAGRRRVNGLRRKRALDILAQGRCAVEAAAAAGLRIAEVRLLDKLRPTAADRAAAGRSP